MYYVSWNDIVGTSSSAVGYSVNSITYYQNGFCYKLSQKTGDGKIYRLPTEAEWEYSARGGNQSNGYIYSGSNTVEDVAWYICSGSTNPVGGKAANELGIYDMSGNVWEWCSDVWEWCSDWYRYREIYRVRRGGSWGFDEVSARVTIRGYDLPDDRDNYIGFRIVCSSE